MPPTAIHMLLYSTLLCIKTRAHGSVKIVCPLSWGGSGGFITRIERRHTVLGVGADAQTERYIDYRSLSLPLLPLKWRKGGCCF